MKIFAFIKSLKSQTESDVSKIVSDNIHPLPCFISPKKFLKIDWIVFEKLSLKKAQKEYQELEQRIILGTT